MRKVLTLFVFGILFGFFLKHKPCLSVDYPQGHGKQFDFETRVRVADSYVQLPSPIYMTDFYPGAWTSLEDKLIDDYFWYKPNKTAGEYFVGDYSQENFGKRDTVRRRLKMVKDLGMYPAIHIMNRHVVRKNTQGQYYRADWPAYGVKVAGEYVGDWQVYKEVYLPVLKELKLPHTIILDMWGFMEWVPDDIPKAEYRRLFWEELEEMYVATVADPAENDYRIWSKRYIEASDAWVPMVAIYLNLNKHTRQTNCDSDGVIESFFRAAGGPGGTGKNPVNGHWLNLHGNFWLSWSLFTPVFRECLDKNQGTWNIVNIAQAGSIAEADYASNIAESFDNVGPRYFYGFIHRIHDKKSSTTSRDAVLSDSDWENFLGDRATKKGLAWTSIWNEYAESIVLEPASVTVGDEVDRISPWVDGKPVFVEKLKTYKKYQVIPPQLMVKECKLINGEIADLIRWYGIYRDNGDNQEGDLNCDGEINISDIVFWYGKYRDQG